MHPRLIGKLTVYTQLMRLDRPIGTLLLLYPTIWAIWIASNGKPDLLTIIMFTIGTFLMRSAGCVINDWADRKFDGHVARTHLRPAARGLVSKKEVYKLTGFLCILAALCLIPFDYKTWIMAIPAVFLAFSYPYMKRFFSDTTILFGFGVFIWDSDGVCGDNGEIVGVGVVAVCGERVLDVGV